MTSKKGVVKVKKERVVVTYAEMWHASNCLYKSGVENSSGCTYQFMASLVFTAFTIESYFNHIGPQLFRRNWKEFERLTPKGKLALVCDKLNITVNYGHRPWQILKRLFDFRNAIAHGKSTTVSDIKTPSLESYNQYGVPLGFALTDWEDYSTKENASKAREDVSRIINQIHAAGKFNGVPFRKGMQIYTAGGE